MFKGGGGQWKSQITKAKSVVKIVVNEVVKFDGCGTRWMCVQWNSQITKISNMIYFVQVFKL